MVIQCTCDCDCSDRDNRSFCLPRLTLRQQRQQSATPLDAGNDMEHRFPYYRRLSNTSSALYGSCPQLLPVGQPCHGPSQSQSQSRSLEQQQEQQELRPYSSLVRSKHRSSVLCNKSWWVSCPRLSNLPTEQPQMPTPAMQPPPPPPLLQPHHCHGTNPARFPLQANAKRHCDNFGSYATLPTIEQQQQQQQLYANAATGYSRHCAASMPPPHHEPARFDAAAHHPSHITDEEDSAFPALADREFHLLHRNIPALRRTGVDTTRIRQYFYPDGGWGWIICGVSFLVHILTTGLQLSYGLLLFYAVQHLHNTSGIELLGALSWSVSMLAIPFVVSLCRKRSIRLLSIVGGLVMPLGILFTSFATEFGQVVFSYGIVFGIGVSMVREASTVMLGNYFKRRRQFVEMVAMSGEGVGIALFSVILKEGVGKAGWRLGLQIVAALTALSFFMGLMYRPASLYHPQRRAIQHLKNQRKKLREKKPKLTQEVESPTRYLFLDISSLKSVTVKILLMTSSVAAFGIYTPMFLMALNAAKEGSDVQELVLLQTFLGISMALGVVLAGALLRRCFVIRQFVINTKIVSQLFISIVALAILFLSFVMGYKGLCILSWLYGIGLGGFQYSLKILALERIKLKHFSKAWGFIRGVQSVPVLISVPLTSFLNDYSLKYGRAGYYICSAAAAISGIIIFFISEPQEQQQQQQQPPRGHLNGHLPTPMLMRHSSARHHRPNLPLDYGYGDYPAPDLLSRSCISLNQMEPYLQATNSHYCQRHMHQQSHSHLSQHHQPPVQHTHSHSHPHTHTHTHPQQLACHNLDMQQANRTPYQLGQGSIGAKMGKRLQRSLSFIQQHNCCDGQMYCSWHSTYELGCRKSPKSQDRQPLICTCSPNSTTYGGGSSARSRSVPEGLSTMSQQCNCRHGAGVAAVAAPSREFIYVPHAYASLQRTPHRQSPGAAAGTGAGSSCQAARGNPQCRLKRSQSLCRPVHFVEQITTSV
ncbi:uncharacterized protein Dvir_GJ21180 [Drosophila virilis]|uniref:Major facilitator superfamily (MFS) profile domain-containing protein n=1 Tax=Drosophila virilis TaxID=7244 RepID=B4LRR5_DROVI|nr:uncharacterized protein Dvir_GJ21180 [Drosophila virilis]